MNKEEINLLKMQLYLNYYKNDITDRYVRVIDKIVLDNYVLNNLDERVYITTLDNYNELKLAKEDNLQLLDKIDKAIEYIESVEPNYKDLHSEILQSEYISNYGACELLEILKGGNND